MSRPKKEKPVDWAWNSYEEFLSNAVNGSKALPEREHRTWYQSDCTDQPLAPKWQRLHGREEGRWVIQYEGYLAEIAPELVGTRYTLYFDGQEIFTGLTLEQAKSAGIQAFALAKKYDEENK